MESENRMAEFAALQSCALKYLEHPFSIVAERGLSVSSLPLLRLWVYPSFGSWCAWHLSHVRRAGKEASMLRRLVWDQQRDQERMMGNPLNGLKEGFHLSPTIEVLDRSVEARVVNELMKPLVDIRIPVGSGKGMVGIDGTTCGMEISQGRILIEWWDVYDPSWAPLTTWAEDARQRLDAICMAGSQGAERGDNL